jgi:hypothetical protein
MAEEPRRFPGFDVVDRSSSWDATTQRVVLDRLTPPTTVSFFTLIEEAACRALLSRLLGLADPPEAPVFELLDQRLASGETDGWRYEDLPHDDATWRRSLGHLDDDARSRNGCSFAELSTDQQIDLLEEVRTSDDWHGLPAGPVWNLWMRYACTAYYSHPAAWNEIGFGGPAYPTGYRALGLGGREPWEVSEVDAEDPEPWADRVERARHR